MGQPTHDRSHVALIHVAQSGEHCTSSTKVVGLNPIVMAAFVSIIMSTFNCYCWISITMEFICLCQVLSPLNIKDQPTHDHSHVP